jgi:hypothetical protein
LIPLDEFPLPPQLASIPRDKPLIYFAMGSSATPRIVANIVESFEGKPYRVIAPIKFHLEKVPGVRVPSNVFVTGWVPALQVNKMADLAVIHGGVGTVMAAAMAGKPVVGVGMQLEQVANLACLERLGFAIRVPKSHNPSRKVQSAIATLLQDQAAKEKAAAFAKVIAQWDGPKLAAETIFEHYGKARLSARESRGGSVMEKLHAFADNLWIVEGPLVRDFGVMFTTRMAIAKLSDGSLWVNSPVPVPFATLQQIVARGPVRYLVTATPRHVWRLEAWHTLFPAAELWVPRTTLATLNKGRLQFTGTLGDDPPQSWVNDFDQLAFRGSRFIEEVIFFHKQSRTVILDDLIQVHSPVQGKPLRNALIELAGVAAPHGGVAIDIRMSFMNRGLARKSLAKLLSWDFDRLIIAHGPCIEKDAKSFVQRAFRWLG